MKLSEMTSQLRQARVEGSVDREVTGLSFDSRRVMPGHVFVALSGQKTDGNRFVEQAWEKGAVAVVVEKAPVPPVRSTVVIVPDAREALALMSALYFGRPADRLKVFGVTGTNGKTTVTFLVKSLMEVMGMMCGLIGTVRYEVGDRVIPASRTTPESHELQELLARMVTAGCQGVAMEVSSHALCQHRVDEVDFHVAAFTNLTQDHLDYHGTMEKYFEAKCRLFDMMADQEKPGVAVINTDDAYGRLLTERMKGKVRTLSFGIESKADYCAEKIKLSGVGTEFELFSPAGHMPVSIPLIGRHNVLNVLAAVASAEALGLSWDKVLASLGRLPGVPGRLERVSNKLPFHVFVDYAHTDDALANVLRTVRELTSARVIVVFGCGGNRDAAKRPMMGRVAVELADLVVVTSDNPRKESPAAIMAQIMGGIGGKKNVESIEDRKEAIFKALQLARKDDVVVIAGKGHENYQEFADVIAPFDDREVAMEALGMISEMKPWKN